MEKFKAFLRRKDIEISIKPVSYTHLTNRSLSYCRFCRNRTGIAAGNAGTL